jgi:putative NADPH-quinone reductase
MKISIILGHPSPSSFNHAIAKTAFDTLTASGHQVVLHDLYAEKFDPIFTADELARDAKLPDVIEKHCQEIGEVDGIIIVHPNYWSQPPAIVRGWTDRALRAGRAYKFEPDGQGGARPVGLLKAKSAMVFNTANTPQEKEEAFFGDPLEILWKKVVFGLCGIKKVYRRNFSSVIVSTPAQRQRWLEEVRSAVQEMYSAQG